LKEGKGIVSPNIKGGKRREKKKGRIKNPRGVIATARGVPGMRCDPNTKKKRKREDQ